MLYTLSQIFQIIAVFFAFLSGAVAIRLIYITRGGLASKAISYITKGVVFLLLAFIILFTGIAANKLHAFEPSWFLAIASVFLVLGFGFIGWGEWILFRELS